MVIESFHLIVVIIILTAIIAYQKYKPSPKTERAYTSKCLLYKGEKLVYVVKGVWEVFQRDGYMMFVKENEKEFISKTTFDRVKIIPKEDENEK